MLTDYRMPNLNGVELVREIRQAGGECAVLMVTAFPDLDEVVVAEQEKLIFQIIPKPWKPEDLRVHTELAISTFRFTKATARLESLRPDE